MPGGVFGADEVDGPQRVPSSAIPRNVYVLSLRTVKLTFSPGLPLWRAEATTVPSGSDAVTRPGTNWVSPRTRLTETLMVLGVVCVEQPNAVSSMITRTDRTPTRTRYRLP
jgi:hypothetical protein